MSYYKFKNNYELEKYDGHGRIIESYDYNETNEIRSKYRVKIATKKSDYITRGHQILDKKNHRMWDNFVNSTVHGDSTWEGASIIEAALETMEMLSCGDELEKSFVKVDVYSSLNIYNDLFLSESASNKANEIVIMLHNRGEEFKNYRNQASKESIQAKIKLKK